MSKSVPKASEFSVDIPQPDVDDLLDRLRRTRFLEDIDNEDWGYGFSTAYLRELIDYWITDYDWRAIERDLLNAYPQYRVELDGFPIHFLHVRGTGPNPTPIILSHGWPWIPWDFKKVIGPLADPAAYGGDPADAFDVVVPSLPGFGFSSPLRRTGATPWVTASLWVRLMQDVLGYGRFAASGGDWGSVVTAYLSHAHAKDVIGTHLTYPALLAVNSPDVTADDYGPDEEGWYERAKNERNPLATSHIGPHSQDPQTLGHGLNDSPAGLAAWILERRRNLADIRNGIESRYTKDELCTIASVYWFTQSIGTSMRFYADTARHVPLSAGRFPLFHDRSPVLEAPTAVSVFPYEVWLMPRSIFEKYSDLRQFVAHDRGGHYGAFEEPELWLDDVRSFFRGLR